MTLRRSPAGVACGMLLLLAGCALASDTASGRKLLGSGYVELDSVDLVKNILNPKDFKLIKPRDIKITKPKPEGGLNGMGVVELFEDAGVPKHVLEKQLPKETVVLSTGSFFWAMYATPFDINEQELPTKPDVTNSNIKDSHDAVVLDFWVEALTSGTIKLDAYFASNECHYEAEDDGREPGDDTFHFEVNGKRLEKLSDASTVSYKTMHNSEDVVYPDTERMQYCEYVKVGVRRYKVTKGQKLRIKFRLADRGDRLFDSAVYLRNRGLGIRK